MTNKEAIALLRTLCHNCELFPKCVHEKPECFKAIELAISALQAQDSPKPKAESVQNVQNEDLISRKAAIDALGERPMVWTDDDQYALGERNQYDMNRLAIETLPSAQPEPQWIPVSERLPESKYEDLEYPTVIVCCGDGAVTLACYYESTKEWGTGEYYDRIINPVAWMPLPEPYREERRTDDLQ